ncbi:MAG TPA: MarR family transcriptional regulator [Candidatus Hydrogenedentes bacterium]|nr:MarR family transcriptional regulator [Candidatus Hydrogenedentota bacterium]HIJ73335.1 MarR family transcriptional regulator [Candidatus Hydrogenedentota bacterium]
MSLKDELGLKMGFKTQAHEAILSIYFTASRIKKRADRFFRDYGLTDVQFNLMMLLKHQAGNKDGLSQVDLSRMMLVNRANITTLIDRMERSELVIRTSVPNDRRYNLIKLTDHGETLLRRVEKAYRHEIGRIIGDLSESEIARVIGLLERVRENVEP